MLDIIATGLRAIGYAIVWLALALIAPFVITAVAAIPLAAFVLVLYALGGQG